MKMAGPKESPVSHFSAGTVSRVAHKRHFLVDAALCQTHVTTVVKSTTGQMQPEATPHTAVSASISCSASDQTSIIPPLASLFQQIAADSFNQSNVGRLKRESFQGKRKSVRLGHQWDNVGTHESVAA